MNEVKIFVEKYIKSPKTKKSYCSVYYRLGNVCVNVGEFATDNEEVAKAKALKTLNSLLNILNA